MVVGAFGSFFGDVRPVDVVLLEPIRYFGRS